MAAEPVYVVTTTNTPGVQYRVSRAEYEHLIELNILDALISATVPADRIVISLTAPINPPVGTFWFNDNA